VLRDSCTATMQTTSSRPTIRIDIAGGFWIRCAAATSTGGPIVFCPIAARHLFVF
jgi:hypothetical protein